MTDANVYLRKAKQEDVDILFEWTNDREVRNNSFDSHDITYEEHAEWFAQMMGNPNVAQYILMHDETPVGQIRLTNQGKDIEISYSISATERGHGYGKEIIRLAIERVKSDFPNVKRIIGKVKPSNVASCNCFSNNKFEAIFQQFEYNIY